ncbi:MAG: hypothetical protein QM680_03360 [Luteolibacter sp.]
MKIQKHPRCKPIQLKTVIRILLILMSLALFYSLVAQIRDARSISKTQSFNEHREQILEKIRRSVATSNWDRIQRIEARYGLIKDPELVQELENAKALMQQSSARQTLSIGKFMDLHRQQEARRDE